MRTYTVTPFKRNDFDPFGLFKDFENELGQFWLGTTPKGQSNNNVRFKETEEAYLFSFDLPGVSNKDIDIDLEENKLSVKAKRKDHFSDDSEAYINFERTFQIPRGIENEKVQAHYENGVLAIALPKKESKKARKIEVSGAEKSKGFFNRLTEGE